MERTRSRVPPFERAFRCDVVDLVRMARLGMAVDPVDAEDGGGLCGQRHMNLVRMEIRTGAVQLPVDAATGVRPRQHRLGIDRFGKALRGAPTDHRRQQRPAPDNPARIRPESSGAPVAVDKAQNDALGVMKTRKIVVLAVGFPPPDPSSVRRFWSVNGNSSRAQLPSGNIASSWRSSTPRLCPSTLEPLSGSSPVNHLMRTVALPIGLTSTMRLPAGTQQTPAILGTGRAVIDDDLYQVVLDTYIPESSPWSPAATKSSA